MKKFALMVLLALPLAFIACTKDKDFKRLDGTWEASSVTVDGYDFMPEIFSWATLEFNEDGKKEGTFTWKFYGAIDKELEIYSGKYTLDAKEDKITLSLDGTPCTFNYVVGKENLELTGIIDGSTLKIKATAK